MRSPSRVPRSREARPGSAVAVVEEGVELRQAGITAPVLVLSEPPPDAMAEAVRNGLVPTVYTTAGIDAAEAAASANSFSARSPRRAAERKVDVHLKVDTGMHRVGADPAEVVDLARAVCGSPHLSLGSVWTHLAVAEGTGDEDRSFTSEQIRRYDEVLSELGRAGIAVPVRHAGNSAGAIAHPTSRYDMVRSGIAIYGELPAPELAPLLEAAGEKLLPVMSLKASVVLARRLGAGERPSYGRRRALEGGLDQWPSYLSVTRTAFRGRGSTATAPSSWVGSAARLPVR